MYKTLLSILVLSLALTAYAAEEPITQETEQADEQPTAGVQSTTSAGAPKKKSKKDGGDIFQPSEEISEDFAVSFPVDI